MARRFVTYNTEDQKAGRVNVDHNGVMKPGGGASFPAAAPYQQLVTDGAGNWVAEERLAWDVTEQKTLIPLNTIEFSRTGDTDFYLANVVTQENVSVSAGDKVAIQYDGTKYDLMVSETDGMLALGNLSFVNPSLENTGEPFCFLLETPGFVTIGTTDTAEAHTVSVHVFSKNIKRIDEALIPLSATPYIIDFGKVYESANPDNSTEERWIGDFSKLYSELIEAIKENRAIFIREFKENKSGELISVDRSFFHTENKYVNLLVTVYNSNNGAEVVNESYSIMESRIDFETLYTEIPTEVFVVNVITEKPDKSREEILEACNAGKLVIAIKRNFEGDLPTVYYLSHIDNFDAHFFNLLPGSRTYNHMWLRAPDKQVNTDQYFLATANYPLPSGEFVLHSSTTGSTKKFTINVDDSGTISATEYTS